MVMNGEMNKKRFGVLIVLFPLVGYLFLFFLVSPVLSFFENVYEINLSLIFLVIGKYILPIIWFVATMIFVILKRYVAPASGDIPSLRQLNSIISPFLSCFVNGHSLSKLVVIDGLIFSGQPGTFFSAERIKSP